MTIKISYFGADKSTRLFTAEVTYPHSRRVPWRTASPMRLGDLIQTLKSIGYSQADIDHALQDEAVVQSQDYWDREIGLSLRQALSGKIEVPPQKPFIEAWLAYSLFYSNKPLRLGEIVDIADSINHLIPTADEIAWAFLRLRNRGWLLEKGKMYGLTRKGRQGIKIIAGKGGVWPQIERLEKWLETNPPGHNKDGGQDSALLRFFR